MKTILRHARTALFVQSLVSWTDKQNEALEFEGIEAALEFAHGFGVSGMELNLVLFGDSGLVLRIGLDEFQRRWAVPEEPHPETQRLAPS